jgi:ATP-binding cassette subfamily C protein
MKLKKRPGKYPCVRQHGEEDCGPACIASIAQFYGRHFTLSQIREVTGTGQIGSTMLGLKRGAEALGFNTRSLRVSSQIIHQKLQLLPAIIQWKGQHFVVLYGQRGKEYVIGDPSVGLRYISLAELAEGWTSHVLLTLTPDLVRFYRQSDDKLTGFGRFIPRILPYRHLLLLVLGINVVLGLLGLALPLLIQILTDDVLVRGDTRLLPRMAIAVILMNLISSSGTFIQSRIIAWFSQTLELGLILEFARQILRLPLTYYEMRRSGEVVSRLDDIAEVNRLVSQMVVTLPSQFFIALVSLGLMGVYSPQLMGLSLLISLLMTLSTFVLRPILEQKTRRLMILQAENQGVLVETFKGALTLKTTGAFSQFWEEFQLRFSHLGNLTLDTLKIAITNDVFSNLCAALGSITLLWYGSHLVITQVLTVGQLLAFHALNEHLTTFVGTAVQFFDEFVLAKTATQRLTEVIDTPAETQNDAKKSWVTLASQADITCEQINFHYPGRVDLLQNFSLTIPGGKVTALIGTSGCGKSTLAKILAGLYPLQGHDGQLNNTGSIRFGIYNQKDIALDCLRRQVVLVPQDAHFWSRSILENFRLGDPHLTDEQIFEACERVGAHDFISRLPETYRTVLGEFGVNLSGGQKQRLALARAIVGHPPILILDESTGALDPESEAQVLDHILYDRQGQTTITISHREQVYLRADWIILLENGCLKRAGLPHDFRSKAYAD